MLRNDTKRAKLCKDCPLARTADIIGDTWILLIVRDLLIGTRRFGDLLSSLEGISTRTLTQKLKDLEACKIVARTDLGGSPPRVEYSLTKKGRELGVIADAMRAYGKKYL